MRYRTRLLALCFSFLLPARAPAQDVPAGTAAQVDALFERWGRDTPGCAVGVSRNGNVVLQSAYGMADLEHDAANSPATIFEAGSVSKQFTAAAIITLVLDGKVSLDDDVRRYVPELPDYGKTITLRHMLNHISGLRDWGSVAGIGGWPRSTRVHTHDHVIDILSRQRALNFEPGHEYSYSNSGFNLLAIIVSRVSGMSFSEFTRTRLFEPLGMTHTQWRDDFTRIVRERAIAYTTRQGGYALDMPFEDVYGNGGLLTTVGDLLIWTENLQTGKLGGPRFLELMHERGVLNDGSRIGYASGLMIGEFNGVPEVSHTGSTGGYRAFLARYPEQRLGVALLCNIGSVNPGSIGHGVAALFLGDAASAPANPNSRENGRDNGRSQRPAPPTLSENQVAEYAGEYYSPDAEATLIVEADGDRLIARRRPATRIQLTPTAVDAFNASAGLGTVRFNRDASGRVVSLSVQQARVYDLRFDRVR